MSDVNETESDTADKTASEVVATTNGTANGTNGTNGSSHAQAAAPRPHRRGKHAASDAVNDAAGMPASDASDTPASDAASTPTADPVPDKEPVAAAVPPASPSAVVQPAEGLRLRMKVWTDRVTGKRYLMPSAVMSDPRTGFMTAYAMSDAETKMIRLTPPEWNALPFFYFKEDGPAPRASARPPDGIR